MSYEQVFRKRVDLKILFDLLDRVSVSKNGSHTLDYYVYKKIVFQNLHIEFCAYLKECYHRSKQFYATRQFTYKSFTTMLWQICKHNNVDIISRVRHVDSEYRNEYVVHLPIIP